MPPGRTVTHTHVAASLACRHGAPARHHLSERVGVCQCHDWLWGGGDESDSAVLQTHAWRPISAGLRRGRPCTMLRLPCAGGSAVQPCGLPWTRSGRVDPTRTCLTAAVKSFVRSRRGHDFVSARPRRSSRELPVSRGSKDGPLQCNLSRVWGLRHRATVSVPQIGGLTGLHPGIQD